jgi:ABC-type lipoprotein export system ATPase subunit
MNPSLVEPLVAAENITKTYRRGSEEVHALRQLSFELPRGEWLAIVGPSGSGKSTLLHLLGCMDQPTSGSLRLNGLEIGRMGDRDQTRFRREHVGFIFQNFCLVPTLTVAENVALPALFARRPAREAVDELLEKVGLTHRRTHWPHELSGGEMQRVAIARALINRPVLLLADEPTGDLDAGTSETILALFQLLHREGLTLAVATHNPSLAALASRHLRLRDGRADVS